MEDSLNKRYILKLLSSFISGVVNISIVALVPKELGPIAYGQFIYLQQLFSQIIAFFDASTSIAFFTKLSANNNRKVLIKFYSFFIFCVSCLLFVFVFVFEQLNVLNSLSHSIQLKYVYLGLMFGLMTWLLQIYISVSDAYALTVSVELVKVIHRLLMLIVLFSLIQITSLNLGDYFYFNILSLFIFIVALSVLFFKNNILTPSVFFSKIDFKLLVKEFYRFCSPLFFFNCISIFIGVFDIWLLQKISGSEQTGYYGLAYSIAAMSFIFTSAMTPVITREFSKSFEKKNIQRVSELFNTYVPMLYIIAVYFSAFLAVEAESLLKIFTDKRFEGAYTPLVIIAMYPIHQTYGQLNAALFFASEDTVRYRNIGFISSVFGLILSYLFIYLFELGAVGFALKMLIVQLFAVNIQLYINTKKLKLNYFYFLSHQLYGFFLFLFLACLSSYFINIENNLIGDFFITGFLYSFLCVLTLFLFPKLIGLSREEILKKFRFIK